uniref:Translocator protein n=2 Tax=Bos TaxID=9903 RepID=A0A8C0ACY4_BOSMU
MRLKRRRDLPAVPAESARRGAARWPSGKGAAAGRPARARARGRRRPEAGAPGPAGLWAARPGLPAKPGGAGRAGQGGPREGLPPPAAQCPSWSRVLVVAELSGTAAAAAMAPPWVPAVGFTLLPSLGGFLGAQYTRGEGFRWYASLQKPPWHPPRWILAPIWGTLYSAMGYGSYMIWKELGGFSKEAMVPLGLYAGQLALNWAWPPLFFGTRQMGWALVDLLLTGGMAAATAMAWHQVSPPAACLLYPYLAWLAFAATLNYRMWQDNQVRRSGRRLSE